MKGCSNSACVVRAARWVLNRLRCPTDRPQTSTTFVRPIRKRQSPNPGQRLHEARQDVNHVRRQSDHGPQMRRLDLRRPALRRLGRQNRSAIGRQNLTRQTEIPGGWRLFSARCWSWPSQWPLSGGSVCSLEPDQIPAGPTAGRR